MFVICILTHDTHMNSCYARLKTFAGLPNFVRGSLAWVLALCKQLRHASMIKVYVYTLCYSTDMLSVLSPCTTPAHYLFSVEALALMRLHAVLYSSSLHRAALPRSNYLSVTHHNDHAYNMYLTPHPTCTPRHTVSSHNCIYLNKLKGDAP
jgi:hypothetical protein